MSIPKRQITTRSHKVRENQLRVPLDNLHSTIVKFRKRALQDMQSPIKLPTVEQPVTLQLADAQTLSMKLTTVDLIVTSPPYAVNAIFPAHLMTWDEKPPAENHTRIHHHDDKQVRQKT